MTLNTTPYNEAPYNDLVPVTVTVSSDVFQYNDFGLQNTNIIISSSDHSTPPTRDISSSRVPRSDGRVISGNFYDSKIIKFKGHVKAASASAFEDLLKSIKKELAAKDGTLQITEPNGTVKEWIASLRNPEKLFADRQAFHITFMPFEMEFLVVNPFGKDPDFTASFLTGQIATTINQAVTNTGSINAKLLVYLNFIAATGVTQVDLQNITTGEHMRIVIAVSANDLFVFDSENRIVTQNGIAIDYSGSFVELDPDDNNIQIDIVGTSHEIEITYKHKNTYL